MSNVAEIQLDPFAPAAPDEEMELGALAASLRLADGFTLLMARCNQADQRQRLVTSLRERLPQLNIQEVAFQEPITHLLDELRSQIETPAPDAIFVSGLENSLPVAAKAANTPLIANLNAARNSFSRYIPCPLVLWVPEYVLTAILHGAPDFFSILSGVYFFSVTLDEIHAASRFLIALEQKTVDNLPVAEKQGRIANIERLLQDYQLLPLAQRDYDAEARLLDQLGHLYTVTGAWADAEHCYHRVLELAKQTDNAKEEATSLLNIGRLYAQQGRWNEAEECYTQSFEIRQRLNNEIGAARVLANIGSLFYVQRRLDQATQTYRLSLSMLEPFGIEAVGWQSYNNLGNAYIAQQQWEKASISYQQSLQIAHKLSDLHGEAIVLSNLAGVCYELQQWTEAEGYCQQALQIVRSVGDVRQEARILENLGHIHQSQGKLYEAANYFASSIAVRHKIGDAVGEGHTLHSLAILHTQKGEWEKALDFAQQAVCVLRNTEDTSECVAALQTLAEIEKRKIIT